jgi:signal transduction histidine kinase
VQVRDHGIGIDAEAQKQLFTRFYRTVNATHVTVGQGLGLYISAEILRLHKGVLFVESAVGQGSTFSLVLPLKQGSDQAIAA